VRELIYFKISHEKEPYSQNETNRARHYLDIFTKFVINQAIKTVIVVNPFIDRSMPVQLLVKAKRMGKTVVIVTRHTFKPHIKKLHEWLTKGGIKLLYHKNLHAKITIIDDSLSIVSSMNFQYNATAGISWEAGIVTINKDTVDSIKASITNLNLEHENSR
jgi:phosphatidylserine/phosphatidylglycerophosphate/cardiolipin synthase-like enzyme